MRIISGSAKGKKLYSPKGRAVRPTADRVKKSIFDILGDRCKGTRVLDLFSGTGSLGLEAISRGAREVVFVENARSALHVLEKNISLCDFDSHAVVMAMSVPRGLSVMGKRGDTFGVVFADPPYGRGWVEKTIEQILANNVLSPKGTIVIEHAPQESPGEGRGKLITLKQKTYGDTAISFLGYERL